MMLFTAYCQDWQTKVLTDAGTSFGHRWFAMDAFNEERHILFFKSHSDHLNNWITYGYSNDEGETWSYEKIDGRDGKVSYVGHISIAPFNASLKLDHCGNPHLFWTVNWFYNKRGPSYAIHAEKKDGVWVKDTIYSQKKNDLMIHFDVDLEIGKDNEPRVVFLLHETEVVYGQRKGKQWNFEKIPGLTSGKRYYSCRLALDSNDQPHIALGQVASNIEYTTKKGNSWKLEIVKNTSNWVVEITCDKLNRPHLTFAKGTSKPFEHAMRKNNNWVFNKLEEKLSDGHANTKQARIKPDHIGNLYALYYAHDNSNNIIFRSSKNNGKTWLTEFRGDVGTPYIETSLPDFVVTNKQIALLYKGDDDLLRYSFKKIDQVEELKVRLKSCPLIKEEVKIDSAIVFMEEDTVQIDFQHTVKVNDTALAIYIWDDARIDGDSINIYLNNELILSNYALVEDKKVVLINLDPKITNVLSVEAINLGSSPPNTCIMIVKWRNHSKTIRLNADLKTNAGVKFVFD